MICVICVDCNENTCVFTRDEFDSLANHSDYLAYVEFEGSTTKIPKRAVAHLMSQMLYVWIATKDDDGDICDDCGVPSTELQNGFCPDCHRWNE